jgi:hypothetical protein
MLSDFKNAPQWFAAIFSAVYISGYLVTVSFFSQFGLSDAELDFVKLKYVHTGIMFNSALMIVGVLVYFFFLSKLAPKNTATVRPRNSAAGKMYLFDATAILMCILLLTIYLAAFLFPPRYLFDSTLKWWLFVGVIVICTVGYAILQAISDNVVFSMGRRRVRVSERAQRKALYILYILCAAALAFDVYVSQIVVRSSSLNRF